MKITSVISTLILSTIILSGSAVIRAASANDQGLDSLCAAIKEIRARNSGNISSAREQELIDRVNGEYLTIRRGTSVRHDHVLYPDSVFYGSNSVRDNLLPLSLGIVPEDCRRDVVNNLMREILVTHGGEMPDSVPELLEVLSDNGFADVAFMLSEKIDSVDAPEWLITWKRRHLGGIRTTEDPTRFELRTDFEIEDLDSFHSVCDTPCGPVVSDWKKNLRHLDWTVEIPAGITADVFLPDGKIKKGITGKHSFACDYNLVSPMVKEDEFVYAQTDFPQCHASTIVELDNGDLVAAYFGGTKERNPDVCIWVNRKPKGSDKWSEPILAADGVFALGSKQALHAGINDSTTKALTGPVKGLHLTWTDAKEMLEKYGTAGGPGARRVAQERFGTDVDNLYRKACWNPVLFQMPSGELWLFYKIGLVMNDWTGWVAKSTDGGKTWSEHQPIEKGFLGPVKNKPVISGNRLICPSSTENEGGWKFHFEILDLDTGEWKYVGPIERELHPLTIDMKADGTLNDCDTVKHRLQPINCIQPSILKLKDGRLQALGRTRNGRLASTWSSDNGDTWTTVTLINAPNNQSGTDALTLEDGRHVLIYNDFATIPGTPKGPRNPCSIAVSDDGLDWKHVLTLEDSPIGDYSYPAIIQGKDGSLHCVYTWRRFRIAYKKVDL